MNKTWTKHGQNMDKTWTKHGQNMNKHGQNMINTWTTHEHHMNKTCRQVFNQHMDKTCSTHDQHMTNTWPTHDQHLLACKLKLLSMCCPYFVHVLSMFVHVLSMFFGSLRPHSLKTCLISVLYHNVNTCHIYCPYNPDTMHVFKECPGNLSQKKTKITKSAYNLQKNMNNTWTKHEQHMDKHGQNMHKTWTKYGQNMNKHGQNMDRTWTTHAQDMDKTWTIHASKYFIKLSHF